MTEKVVLASESLFSANDQLTVCRAPVCWSKYTTAAPSVEAHQGVNGPDTGRNSRGRPIIEKKFQRKVVFTFLVSFEINTQLHVFEL